MGGGKLVSAERKLELPEKTPLGVAMSSSPAPMSTHIPRSRAEPARKQACVLVPPVSTSPVSLLMGVSASLHDFSPRCRRGLLGGGILQRWISACVSPGRPSSTLT